MYDKFQSLDGSHAWRDVCRDGYVDYRARIRTGGRVAWFNFDFAKELQLIPTNHANRITSALERVLLDTFALQIINEYDLTHDASLESNVATPQTYMATRSLSRPNTKTSAV